MGDITSIEGLKQRIVVLESEQTAKGEVLKEQFFITYNSLKPVNLLISTLEDISSSPHLLNNLADTGIGLASGYLSKKIFIGTSGNIIRKMLGSLLQVGVANLVAKHSDTIKSIGIAIIQHVLKRTEKDS